MNWGRHSRGKHNTFKMKDVTPQEKAQGNKMYFHNSSHLKGKVGVAYISEHKWKQAQLLVEREYTHSTFTPSSITSIKSFNHLSH